jgi:hypothetical protein
LADDPGKASDLRLFLASPPIDAGIVIPAKWPDPLAKADRGKSGIGAVPFGV